MENNKVYYIDDSKRGSEIIAALEELGGKNTNEFYGILSNRAYFINNTTKQISAIDSLTVKGKLKGYTLKTLPPESWTPKVFEYCLMGFECDKYDRYELCQFAFKDEFYHAVGGGRYTVCIPYKGNEHLLGRHTIK